MLIGGLAAAAGACVPRPAYAAPLGKTRTFRFAHFSDMHIAGRHSVRKVHEAINHALGQKDKPQMIVNSGDSVFDLMEACERRAAKQWRNFQSIFGQNIGVPVEHILGNHDIWGVNQSKCGTTGNESKFGKQWAMDELQIDKRYRAFDRAGWKWIYLDGTIPDYENGSYEARFDAEQYEWLESTLKSTPSHQPIIIVTHEPILSAAAFFHGDTTATGDFKVARSLMHIDGKEVSKLLSQYPNVNLVLSGHLHLSDRVDYMGVSHCCNGAICGNWWNGSFAGFPPGYALVDLYSDGSFENTFVAYESGEKLPGC